MGTFFFPSGTDEEDLFPFTMPHPSGINACMQDGFCMLSSLGEKRHMFSIHFSSRDRERIQWLQQRLEILIAFKQFEIASR